MTAFQFDPLSALPIPSNPPCSKLLDEYAKKYRMLLSNNIDLTKKNALLLTQTRCLRDERNEAQHLLKAFTASNRAQQLEFRGQLDRLRNLLRQALSDSNQKDDQLKELQENNLQLQSLLTESLAEAFNSHHLLATVQEEGELPIQNDFEVAPDPPILTDRLTPPHADDSSSSATSIREEGSSLGNKENHSPPHPFSFIYHQGPPDTADAATGKVVIADNEAQDEDNSTTPTHSETASSQPHLQKEPSFGHRQAASSKEADQEDDVFSFSSATPAFNHLVAAAFQASKDIVVPKLTRIEEKDTNDENDENGDSGSSAAFLTPCRPAAPPNNHPATGTICIANSDDDNVLAAGMRSSARTRGKTDRVSYALPKLNSKLRQGDPFTFGKPEDINLRTRTKGKRISIVYGPAGDGGDGDVSGNVSAARKLLQDDTT